MRPGTFYNRSNYYARLCGGVLLDMWHCSAGVETSEGLVTGWRSVKRGIALTQTDTAKQPTYAVDGAHFNGLPVVQFNASAASLLQNLSISPTLGDNTDPVTLCAVARLRTTPPTASFFSTGWLVARNVPGNGTNMLVYQHGVNAQGWGGYIGFRDTSYNYQGQWWTPAYHSELALVPTMTYSRFDHVTGTTFEYAVGLNKLLDGAGLNNYTGRGTGGYSWMKVGNPLWWNTTDKLDLSVAAILVLRHGYRSPPPYEPYYPVEWSAIRNRLCADFGVAA